MEILINDAKSPIKTEDHQTLGEVFDQLNAYFTRREESVLAVLIDGNLMNPEQQKIISGESVGTYEKMELQVVETRLLPVYTLEEFKPLLTEVVPASEKIAIALQSGNTSEALKDVDSLLQVWAILFQSLTDSSKLLKFKLADIKTGDSNVEALTQTLTSHLQEIKEGLTNRDYVTVADILEYEIAPAAEKWLSVLDDLIEHIHKLLANEPAKQ